MPHSRKTIVEQSSPSVNGIKAVILAGGQGSRLAEETTLRPKPMVEVGGRPILWHIMKIYSACGINDFIICLGYKGSLIKEYFANYFLYSADVTIDLANDSIQCHRNESEPWRVTLIDTGASTMTGGRLKRALPYVQNDDLFCLTYGDGVANVNVNEVIAFHKQQGRLATVTAMQPTGRFGSIAIDGAEVTSFREKPQGDGRWVSGGFFVLSPKVGDYLEGDNTVWENEPLDNLARNGQLSAFKHKGFFHPMDTIHDRGVLEELWATGKAPWKVW
jgi:glucose-1-phosphate cytidylyltransferase